MVTNRKSLAYTSKRPGKTQQFNFFAINDKPDLEREIKYGDAVGGDKDDDAFYLVDLPGFGYAQVPEYQRQKWLDFMHEYLSSRKNLRVVFHLIDSRHGPTGEDATIMKQISDNLPASSASAKYVVVLTKADKNIKGGAAAKESGGRVSRSVMDALKETMKESGIDVKRVPVVITSGQTKLGRDQMWKFLRLAAEY